MIIHPDINQWLSDLKKQSDFKVSPVELKDSREWKLADGAIRHKSGRFFKIAGVKEFTDKKRIEHVLIDQREIGTLGFFMKAAVGKNQLLVQAKIEPGNVGIIQLAPTLQATDSNANRVHGGSVPKYLEYFCPGSKYIVYDKLQSEQGTRFFQKRNRNVLAIAGKGVKKSLWHKWMPVEDLLDLLAVDYLVNTDARSVLTCVPWKMLVGRMPFSRHEDAFGTELRKSYEVSSHPVDLQKMKKRIAEMQNRTMEKEIVPLGAMKEWKITGTGVVSGKRSYAIKHISVRTRGREVLSWDQPIIKSMGEGNVFLECGREGGILHFLFRASPEVGLYNSVELTPTIVIEPGEKKLKYNSHNKIVRAECRQSEEGGRFFQDINLFRIVDVGKAYSAPKGCYWLTLCDIKELLKEEGWFTNEARSALSLLLLWL